MQRPVARGATPATGRGAPTDGGAEGRRPASRVIPRLAWVTWALSIVGLGLSGYLTYEHYTGNQTLSCPATGTFNCLKVTTSSWSQIAGVPVAVFGLVFFVVMGVVCWPAFWRTARLDVLRVVAAFVGIGSVIYLVWVELFEVNAICPWCTGVHAVTLLLLAAVLWTTAVVRSQDDAAVTGHQRTSGR